MYKKVTKSSVIYLDLSKITLDGRVHSRQRLNIKVIAEYAKAMKKGVMFPPVIVFFDGSRHLLADGFHRFKAKESIGESKLLTAVRCGSRRDAILFAAGANSTHGFQRTNADKHRVVEWLLNDNEWSRWSDNEIARKVGVSQPFVGKLRKTLLSYNGFKRKGSTNKSLHSTQRLIRRNGKVQTMNVSNIGCKSTATKD
ncbi:hypothetical protein HRE53_29775 (plasmid) [Acaryochloris sp. 'Moss Beach']|uniref:hypothetical protein n=1 Tax=Acaryochloris sp. 'Moss Beach' TaxID=2740837 RepID=UPI001F38540F|nr:hypothetical protein [Acaryochloris sp. 'Moss Beach']UJB72795.1 hypothetical protein HRE53_29775 [Acaryochloris sp. 'Moss Beach']